MDNFKEKLLQKIQEEIDSPAIKVLYFRVGEPVSDDIIRQVEEKFGFPLPADIKSFYKQCNGIAYRAYEVDAKTAKSGAEVGKIWQWDDEYIDWGTFCDFILCDWLPDDRRKSSILRHLYIRPLEDVLLGKQYLIEEDLEEEANLYLFDAWDYYFPVMLVVDAESQSIEVMIGEDYGACYGDYPPTPFSTYMDNLLESMSSRFFGERMFQIFG